METPREEGGGGQREELVALEREARRLAVDLEWARRVAHLRAVLGLPPAGAGSTPDA